MTNTCTLRLMSHALLMAEANERVPGRTWEHRTTLYFSLFNREFGGQIAAYIGGKLQKSITFQEKLINKREL